MIKKIGRPYKDTQQINLRIDRSLADWVDGVIKTQKLGGMRASFRNRQQVIIQLLDNAAGTGKIVSQEVTLENCPIGLFMFNGTLCLKTEYGNNEGRIDCYIVSSGEFFWGGTDDIETLRKIKVQPIAEGEQVHAQ